MKKLFEIPIYAVNRKSLSCRVKKAVEAHPSTLSGPTEKHKRIYQASLTYPQRLWEYNHIIGYIAISTTGQDILFDVYRPTPPAERYKWQSMRKKFLYNIAATGAHFYVGDNMKTEAIRERIEKMLDDIIKTHIPKHQFVDREAFDSLNPWLDYRNIIDEGTA